MVTKQKQKMLIGHFNGILATVHIKKRKQNKEHVVRFKLYVLSF